MCEICSELTLKISERLYLASLLLTLNTFYTFSEYYYCCWLWTEKCLLGSLDFSVGQYYSTTLEKFLGWWFYVFSLMSVKQQRTVFRCKATLLVSYTDNNESIPASSVFITTMLITGSICEHSNHWSPCYQWSKKRENNLLYISRPS